MNRKIEDEDYWNSSDTTGFSFDDDEISSATALFDSYKLPGKSKTRQDSVSLGSSSSFFGEFSLTLSTEKSLETLISRRSINLILDGVSEKKEPAVRPDFSTPPTVMTTVRSISLGKPYSLQLYRSLELKTQLLEAAVSSGDGNAILSVLLFLRNTLKKKLFCQLLQFHSSAVPIYLNYLTTRFEFRSAVEILLMLGSVRQAALKDFQFLIQPNQNIDKRLHNLRILVRDHFSQSSIDDREPIENFLKFTDWQKLAGQKGFSAPVTVFESLYRLCSDHWHELKGQPLSPLTLTNTLAVSERQFHWAVITSRAKKQTWDDISGLMFTKGWLGAKKIKTVVPVEKIVIEFKRQQAPDHVTLEYFSLMDNLEKRMDLARKLSWHTAVIDTYVAMKDRQGLVQYQAALNPQSNDYLHAEIALRNTANKWKN